MPFVPAEHPKCPKCEKSVYAAEERIAGGHKWHKMCFKCEMCGKFLDSTNCAEHDKELYCKNCHGRKYGPKGYGFGGGAGCLSTDTGDHLAHVSVMHRPQAPLESRAIARAPEGEGCPRCGGFVYMAEQMLAKGRGYHKECFNCFQCHKTLNSVIHCDGPDGEVYCRVWCNPSLPASRHYPISTLNGSSESTGPRQECYYISHLHKQHLTN
ncbi:muscle LIM protein Mlp84B isoform X5 [Adelges cooleyi]|uniref:muscle LIM protein Mlp84B isoform X5 n=1 Tax=Adelges cooleyi TaxID=133065 RepID=UPI00217FB386|nr:muscle LIM protein Mlp84B isoform X5 [Adelges cooleyi]